ncbi:F-box/WD repeat-containing protein 7 isoform X2 [Rhinoderma darwinii]|uniref:F-box/WD repeat-containing protein 7 isoform X2 n=1 Tax=Rhinoderma darwinii TaxID=43563 RepID=UPI003F660CD0
MCGCGCSIISSLMKRLGRSTCCSDLLSCSYPSDPLQRLSFECLSQPKNVKTFASSLSLANVHEVASWLLEMNQELLSVGSKRRRTGGSVRGNASSSQADEEQMNRVEEEEEQQHSRQQGEEHIGVNGEVDGPRSLERCDLQQEHLEENNNSCMVADRVSEDQPEDSEQQEDEDEDEEHVCDGEDEDEEEMDQDSDDFDQSDDSSREDEHRNASHIPNSNSRMDISLQQKPSPFQAKTKMKRKLDHGSEVRSFSLGKKPCKGSEYTSTTGLVPCTAAPTTFGDLRAANGQGQQRRRITSVQPPSGLQEWLKMFQGFFSMKAW